MTSRQYDFAAILKPEIKERSSAFAQVREVFRSQPSFGVVCPAVSVTEGRVEAQHRFAVPARQRP